MVFRRGSVRPLLHLDNRVLGETAVDGEIGEAPAARLAQSLDALAESRLQGLRLAYHPYRFSGAKKNHDSTSQTKTKRMSLSVACPELPGERRQLKGPDHPVFVNHLKTRRI